MLFMYRHTVRVETGGGIVMKCADACFVVVVIIDFLYGIDNSIKFYYLTAFYLYFSL